MSSTITLRASGTVVNGTTSLALAQPTGTVTGDVLLAFIVDHATSGTTTAPTGWTRAGGVSGTAGRFQVFYAASGFNGLTGTSWTWSSLTSRAEGVIVGYYNANTSSPMDVTASARQNASGTIGTTSITPVTAGDMIIAAFAAYASGSTWSAESTTSPGSLTEILDSANSSYCSIAVAGKVQSSATATGVSSATMGTAGTNAGALLALKPAQSAFSFTSAGGSITTAGAATISSGGPNSIFLVQSNSAPYTGGGTQSCAFTSNNAPGNLLVALGNITGLSIPTCMDTAGNIWMPLANVQDAASTNHDIAIFYCSNCKGGANTVTMGGGTGSTSMIVAEFSGVDTLDASGNVVTGLSTTWASNPITTAYVNELLIGCVSGAGGQAIDSPFSLLGTNESWFLAFYQIVSSTQTGVQATGSTPGGSTNCVSLNSFYQSGGGSTFSYVGGGSVALAGAATTSVKGNFTFASAGGSVTGVGAASTTLAESYVGSGNVVLSGAATTTATAKFAHAGSGSFSASGTAATQLALGYSGTGSITTAGVASTNSTAVFAHVGSGSVAMSGAAAILESLTYAGSGNIVATGLASTSITSNFAFIGSGNIYAAGTAPPAFALAYAGAGSINLAGSATTSLSGTETCVGSGAVTVTGAASITSTSNYSMAGSGAISAAGTAAVSSKANFASVGSGSVEAYGSASTAYTYSFEVAGSGAVIAAGSANIAMTTNGHGFILTGSVRVVPAISIQQISMLPVLRPQSVTASVAVSLAGMGTKPALECSGVGTAPLIKATSISNALLEAS